MENFVKPHKIEKSKLLDLALALIIEVLSFGVCVPLHSLIVHNGRLLQEPINVGGEMSEPTTARLIFGIVAFIIGVGLIIFAHYIIKKNKELIGFGLAYCGGVFLWQSIGECLWHFQIGGIQIDRIETISSFPLVIIFVIVLIALGFKKNKNFALWVVALSFASNWLGHYITIGLYPIVQSNVDWKTWAYVMSGTVGGTATIIGTLLSLFCCKTKRGVYLASMLIFIGIGIIYFGFTEA